MPVLAHWLSPKAGWSDWVLVRLSLYRWWRLNVAVLNPLTLLLAPRQCEVNSHMGRWFSAAASGQHCTFNACVANQILRSSKCPLVFTIGAIVTLKQSRLSNDWNSFGCILPKTFTAKGFACLEKHFMNPVHCYWQSWICCFTGCIIAKTKTSKNNNYTIYFYKAARVALCYSILLKLVLEWLYIFSKGKKWVASTVAR